MIDFDGIDDWMSDLSAALAPHLPASVGQRLLATAPEFIEDALNVVFELVDRDVVIDATLEWLRSKTLLGYHGTRLTDTEATTVRDQGLVPLKATSRRVRLVRALSGHPRWSDVAEHLDNAICVHGEGCKAGRREDQVHLTLSRSGLVQGFNHYLTHGAV